MTTCQWAEGCIRRDLKGRGLCSKHYDLARRIGTIDQYARVQQERSPRTFACPYCETTVTTRHQWQRFCSEDCSRSYREPSYEVARDRGWLVCRCDTPDGPDDGQCDRCWRLILTPERAAYLRARKQVA